MKMFETNGSLQKRFQFTGPASFGATGGRFVDPKHPLVVWRTVDGCEILHQLIHGQNPKKI